jgi:soluble lytic murein transglycosylase
MKKFARGYLAIPLEAAPERFWHLTFPLPYRESLERYASLHSIDVSVLAGLIRQESEFDPKAVSRANAYGLTQVLPSTGRELSRRAGMPSFSPAMLFEPEINLRLGTLYLKSLLDQHDGAWETTLASYNAGKSRVNRWLTWAEYREPAEFIENIPFTETREYVQAVLRNADIYRRLYGHANR